MCNMYQKQGETLPETAFSFGRYIREPRATIYCITIGKRKNIVKYKTKHFSISLTAVNLEPNDL